jgi:ubiquinone/menaquinone biosynthesis C-methylase UbiE
MIDYRKIYNSQADSYDMLVSREDYEGNIINALESILPLSNLSVIDLGAGTGRISRILSHQVGSLLALDISIHMLEKARENLASLDSLTLGLVQADNRSLPLRSRSFDLAIAGWTFSHFTGWYADSWKSKIDQCLSEIRRVLKSEGTMIILETLGTGRKSPQPPTSSLARYYTHLQEDLGFEMKWIRSDYHFQSMDEAIYLTQFFFGEDLAKTVAKSSSKILPECTGIWWLKL